MLTKWQHIEDWIRDNQLTWWRFSLEKTGVQTNADGQTEQKRSNMIVVLSDAYDGDLDNKISLTKKRIMHEQHTLLYGQGKRGKENAGMLYCEVRLDDVEQQHGTQAVASVPSIPVFDEDKLAERVRRECMLEFENKRYEEEKKAFAKEKEEFEAAKGSAIGLLVQYLSPVVAAMSGRRVAGVDASAPVQAAPVQALEAELEDELFTDEESDKLFDLMARFKAVEPRYLELIEKVVTMAESGDATYNAAKMMLL